MTLVVFTAVIGETEPLQAPRVVEPSVRYLCFTDRPAHVPAPYEAIAVAAAGSARTQSRRIKILAEHPTLQAADATLWHDASYQLWRDPRWVCRRVRRGEDLVALKHHRRCLEDEAVLIARYGYVALDQAQATVARYRAAGFDRLGMTAGGLLGRRVTPAVQRFNAAWWAESQTAWGGRDQASLDFCAWRAGVTVGYVQGRIKANRYAGWRIPIVDEVTS